MHHLSASRVVQVQPLVSLREIVSLAYHDRIMIVSVRIMPVSARIRSKAARITCGDFGDVCALYVSHGITIVSCSIR